MALAVETSAPVEPQVGTAVPPRATERVGALDGLRAIAVIAVLVYHLAPRTLPAGFLGVDVFMVLSGYLITGLLVGEHVRNGAVALSRFWVRRLRRLAPAMVALVAVVAVWAHLDAARALVPTIRTHGLAGLLYVINWKLIVDSVSYGGSLAAESPFVHLWSLAVEAQFYVVWAVVVVTVLRIARGRPIVVAAVGLAGALISAVAMALAYAPADDPLRLYYGTDTRSQAFLLGGVVAVLAVVAPEAAARLGRRLGWAATAALVGIIAAFARYEPGVLYRGGFLAVAAATALVIGAAGAPPVAWLLDRAPLRVIGRVSYGIYLWHWPAIAILTPSRTGWDGATLTAARLAMTALGTALSWFVVERPAVRVSVRSLLIGSATCATAVAAALLALPSASVVPYQDVATDDIPEPSVVSAPSTTVAVPSSASSVPVIAPGTMVIVGDSGMFDESPAMTAAFHAGGWTVVDASYPGIGVTRPGESLRATWGRTVRDHDAALVVVMLGDWDIDWLNAHGDDAYRAELDDAVASLRSGGAQVLWLSMLPGGRRGEHPVDRLFAELPDRHDGVDFLDISPALVGPDGDWPVRVGDQLLRKPDEWHLCPDGAAAVAGAVIDHLGIAAAGWEDGPWRGDRRYNDPPGGCRA